MSSDSDFPLREVSDRLQSLQTNESDSGNGKASTEEHRLMLEQEVLLLREMQVLEMRRATFLGMTKGEAQIFESRSLRIHKILKMLAR
jgi:hypothetical protein